jgi:hypothetical protein
MMMKALSICKCGSGQRISWLTLTKLAIIASVVACWPGAARGDESLPQIKAETSLSEEQVKDALSASEKQLSYGKQELDSMLKTLGSGHPRVRLFKAAFEQMQDVHVLKQQLLPLLAGPRDEEQQNRITRLIKDLDSQNEILGKRIASLEASDVTDVAERKAEAERQFSKAKAAQELAMMRKELELAKQQLAQRQMQLMETAKQMAEEERERALPPIESGDLKIFSLQALPAKNAAEAIESLFGANTMRVAIDDRTNSLIVFGKPDSLPVIEALLTRLDQQEQPKGGDRQKAPTATESNVSLLLRLFWLADGKEGSDPADVLPASVLRATKKLGLKEPRLVAQTVNSLAVGNREAVDFATSVPAVLAMQMVGLECSGEVKMDRDQRADVKMQVQVAGPGIQCQLKGSLATPLGHYMVLGTANSIIGLNQPAVPGADPMAMNAEFGGPAAGFGPDGGALGPEGGVPGEGGFPAGQGPPALKTSRFAFVVQVIEGESFPAEE